MKSACIIALLAGLSCAGLRNLPAQTLPDAIDAILARPAVADNSWTVLIENTDGSLAHYQRNPTAGYAPASVTKTFTTSAAFGLLGTNYAFATRVYRNGTLSGGVLNGDLNLVSEHDPTWNTSVFSDPRTPLNTIAAALKALGLNAVTGNVQCYGLCAYGLGSMDNLAASSTQSRNATAATNFVGALQAQGITVGGGPAGQTGFAPPGTLLHTHYSTNLTRDGKPLNLGVICVRLNKVSHNVMADGLLRHLGWKFTGTDSYTAGRDQVLPWLRSVAGLTTNGIVMNDGSGLSWNNRFSARQCVDLHRFVFSAFPTYADTLPIACTDGTLGSRLCGPDTSGRVRAKTGSLSIAIALSGYIVNRHDNQRFLFAFVGNRSSIDQSATRQAIDDCVTLLGARGVPLSPQLTWVRNNGDGHSLTLFWSDEKFPRTGYRLYRSDDGINFSPALNLGPTTHSFTESGLAPGRQRYYKVSVVGNGGESKASRVYGAQVGTGSSRLLLVDGNDRWQFQTSENPFVTNHAFAAIAGRAISGPAFDTVNHNALIAGTVALTNYPAVVWLLGEESTADETFAAAERALVADYLSRGGNLFASGAEIGWHLDRASGPTATERDFYRRHLRAAYVADDAATYAFMPAVGGIFAGNSAGGFDNGTRGIYDVDYPDVLAPTNGSVVAMNYVGGSGGAAAVQYDGAAGGGRVMNWGFPFEAITNAVVRQACMSDVLRFFDVLDLPQVLPPHLDLSVNTLTLTWSASAGLRYRVQYRSNATDGAWLNLPGDVIATNTLASKSDSLPLGNSQRLYRVMLVD